jgi:hypothetical protein
MSSLRYWAGAAAAAFLASTALADKVPSDFDRLSSIAGQWRSTGAGGKPLAVDYRLMSAGTVLVETYGAGSGSETLTIFHPDGARTLATHYCAQGNQPRLKLESSSPTRWIFTFLDSTNLQDPEASHLVRLVLELTDAKHLVRTETYREKGKEDVSRLPLAREG